MGQDPEGGTALGRALASHCLSPVCSLTQSSQEGGVCERDPVSSFAWWAWAQGQSWGFQTVDSFFATLWGHQPLPACGIYLPHMPVIGSSLGALAANPEKDLTSHQQRSQRSDHPRPASRQGGEGTVQGPGQEGIPGWLGRLCEGACGFTLAALKP